MIKKVIKKIVTVFFFAKDASKDVIKDFSVSFTFKLVSDEIVAL